MTPPSIQRQNICGLREQDYWKSEAGQNVVSSSVTLAQVAASNILDLGLHIRLDKLPGSQVGF
jgi:hypothetical protein